MSRTAVQDATPAEAPDEVADPVATLESEETFTKVEQIVTDALSPHALPDALVATGWLAELRRDAAAAFEVNGYPSRTDERWRQTSLKWLGEPPFNGGTSVTMPEAELLNRQTVRELVESYRFGDAAAVELVFVNGRYAPHLSQRRRLPARVIVRPLLEALEDHAPLAGVLGRLADPHNNPFVALNTAQFIDGVAIDVGPSAATQKPIHLLFLTVGAEQRGRPAVVTRPRVVVDVAENAHASFVETFAGDDGAYLTTPVTEMHIAADATVEHYKLNREGPAGHHVATMAVRLGRAARFVSQSATIGGRVTRNDLDVTLAGEHAAATLNGLVVLSGEQHCDNHTLLDHAAPNCPSYELYKHVLDDRSTGVFKGQIHVHSHAQKTDAVQNSRTLLLSRHAQMNSQPALEIYADDVKCTHGSTTGPVDEGAVFYLQSRGVSREQALRLLTYAFAADLTRRIKVDPVRERLEHLLAARHGLPQDFRIQAEAEHDEDLVY